MRAGDRKEITLALRSTSVLAARLLTDASRDLAQTFSKESPRLLLKSPPGVLDA